jgi:hypothetical protein
MDTAAEPQRALCAFARALGIYHAKAAERYGEVIYTRAVDAREGVIDALGQGKRYLYGGGDLRGGRRVSTAAFE